MILCWKLDKIKIETNSFICPKFRKELKISIKTMTLKFKIIYPLKGLLKGKSTQTKELVSTLSKYQAEINKLELRKEMERKMGRGAKIKLLMMNIYMKVPKHRTITTHQVLRALIIKNIAFPRSIAKRRKTLVSNENIIATKDKRKQINTCPSELMNSSHRGDQ